MYRLHKWLGISALVISTSHWLLAQGPKWLVGLGWLTRPAHGPRPVPEGALPQFLLGQRGLAEGIGEWAFYGALTLMVLALVKRFPYRPFFQTHRLLALAYLALVWHAFVLLNFEHWASPLGVALALLMAAGSVSAVLVLLRRVALKRQVMGEVESVRLLPALDVLEVGVRLKGRWPGHAAGQFAFVTLHQDEGPHPFTLTTAWTGDGHVGFIVKALGDYTRTLAARLAVGDAVKVEGPYGCFTFQGEAQQQIWVAGGIGITPFISRMKTLAAATDGKTIDLFHTTAVYDPTAIGLLEQDAAASKVRLHVLWDERDGRLDAERLTSQVPGWRDAGVWFCGPARFGQALKKRLTALGLPEGSFHQELFEMR
jgi:predicted ferric reductase